MRGSLLVFGRSLFFFVLLALLGVAGSPSALAGTAQVITFSEIGSKLTTDDPFDLEAAADSGLPVRYRILSTTGTADVSGSRVTLTGIAGGVTVEASQPGDDIFEAAEPVVRTFLVIDVTQGFKQVASGGEHTMGIREDGTLWAWGGNGYGQLGLGSYNQQSRPVQVGDENTWASVACGQFHTVAVRTDGTLWTWGYNSNGQLGFGNYNPSSIPARVGAENSWTSVACGGYHTVALRTEGTLWAWGYNQYGQLGLGHTDNQISPVQVGAGSTWSSVACGDSHTAAVQTDGTGSTLWSWGFNIFGQLGLGHTIQQNSPVRVDDEITWNSVACGAYHTVAVRTDGTLWACGYNGGGQLGIGSYYVYQETRPVKVGAESTWVSVASRGFHTAAVRTDGTLWVWGENDEGKLGLGHTNSQYSPVQVGTENTWASAACGLEHTMAVRIDGTLWAWGGNNYGNLGVGDTVQQQSPLQVGIEDTWASVACGQEHTVAVRSDGTLWAWGSNGSGQLGIGTYDQQNNPVQVGTDTTWNSVACGASHTVAVRTDGTLWAWGYNYFGQLGIGSSTYSESSPVQVGDENTWASVACGQFHTVAVQTDGTIWAWGENGNGQLGLGNINQQNSPVKVDNETIWSSVACGTYHTVAVRTDGTLWAWGYNYFGQLGLGNYDQSTTPVQVGDTETWASVSCGEFHTVAVRSNGTLWAWGYNGDGQLGLGNYDHPISPVQVGDAETWASVACGLHHTVAARKDGTLWAWGSNGKGQLGLGNFDPAGSPVQVGFHVNWASVACGSNHTAAVRTDGTLSAWGRNSFSQLGFEYDTSIPNIVWPTPTTQILTFPALSGIEPNQTVTVAATSDSGLPLTYYISGSATLQGDQLTTTSPGTVTITAKQSGDHTWRGREETITFTIPKYPATVEITGLVQTYDGTSRAVETSTEPAGLAVNVTYDGSDTPPTGAGSYEISAVVDDPFYEGSATATLVVAKASQTIDFTSPGNRLVSDTVDLVATGGDSTSPVTFAVNPGLGSVNGNVLTFHAIGAVGVTASQGGDDNYLAATDVEYKIFVTSVETASFAAGPAQYSGDIYPGGRQVIHFSVTSPRFMKFASMGNASLRAELYDSSRNLVASFDGDTNFDLQRLLYAGEYSLEVFREEDDGPSQTYQLAIDASNLAVSRPDVAVGKSLASVVGVGIYSPAVQSVRMVSENARTVSGWATVGNGGNLPDAMILSAKRGLKDLFDVDYFGPSGNITASLAAGTYRTGTMDQHAGQENIQIKVSPNKRKLVKKVEGRKTVQERNMNLQIRVISEFDPSIGDAVEMEIRTK